MKLSSAFLTSTRSRRGGCLHIGEAVGGTGYRAVLFNPPAAVSPARVPEQVGFRTKPQLARVMLERALDTGTSAAWVTADEVYPRPEIIRGQHCRDAF
jgi:hypothetical protein